MRVVAPHRLMPSAEFPCLVTIRQKKSMRQRLEFLQMQPPAAEARRPDDDWADSEHTNHSQRAQDVQHRCDGEEVVASMGCP